MNRATAPDDPEHILAAVAARAGGISVEALHPALQARVPRRTLQRRLAER